MADDARTVIDWITRQPWSDGRVAMYGEDYSGFTQWAAAKRLPPALKAIAASATIAPGIDLPREGNIYHNAAYRLGAICHRQRGCGRGKSIAKTRTGAGSIKPGTRAVSPIGI